MANQEIEFRYFKTERDLVTSLLFIQHYFWQDTPNNLNFDLQYSDYAERNKIIKLYKQENEDYQKHLKLMKFAPKAIQELYSSTKLANIEAYKVMIALMDIYHKDTLDFYDLQDALENSKHLFETYFDACLKEQPEKE